MCQTIQYMVTTMRKTIQQTKVRKQSATRSTHICRFVVLGSGTQWLDALGRDETVVCPSGESVFKAIERTTRDSLWISSRSVQTKGLVKTLVSFLSKHQGNRQRFGDLLMLESPKVHMLPTLHGLFGRVIGETSTFRKLPFEQLAEVLSSPVDQRRDVFIGGVLDTDIGTLTLVRGNLERQIVPLSIFRPSGKLSPAFRFFELDDYGQTLRFGKYEATADVVLWEADPDYRKRAKAKERAHAEGFGPSLRRLRKQRGLSQSDFPNVARKTISRIEKSEVEKPHGTTLNRIAKTLGVAPEEIETY